MDKIELVARVLQARRRGATMVFTRTKRTAQKVADELAERGFKVGAVHGDLGQGAREKALKAFRTGKIDVLVATDVAARGIDIEDVTHVVNYQCPEDEKIYVHRIGRTGRAGRAGVAVTLVDWDELARWSAIDTGLGLDCPDPAETYSSSPHLFTELDIPADAGGRVGPAKQAARRGPGADSSAVRASGPPQAGGAPTSRRRDGGSTPRATTRSRRRTRGGNSVGGHVETQPDSTTAETKTADSAAHSGGRRRRRRSRQSATTPG
jgi:superfamily II DNA/RNA helicase